MDPADELDQLGVREMLDQDSRPTFIIDLDADDEKSHTRANALKPVFSNSALCQHQQLHDVVTGGDVSTEPSSSSRAAAYLEFRNWVVSVTKHDDSKDIFPLFFEYEDMLWTGSTVRRRWRLISGNILWKQNVPSRDFALGGPVEVAAATTSLHSRTRTDQSDGANPPSEKESLNRSDGTSMYNAGITLASSKRAERLDFSKTSKTSLESLSGKSSGSKQGIVLAAPEKACTDWTAAEPKGVLTEHMKFARSVNWDVTPLGPMSTWSREFRQIVNLAMCNPHPVSVLVATDCP